MSYLADMTRRDMRGFTPHAAGFTLIELLVVIAIIGLLSSTIMASLNSARTKAQIARAQSDVRSLYIAMEIYIDDHGELPPIGDNCSACANPCSGSWTAVIDALMADNLLQGRIDRDPWGNYYCYDDNYRVPDCSLQSALWSMGPNGTQDNPTWWNTPPEIKFMGDDIGAVIEGPQC